MAKRQTIEAFDIAKLGSRETAERIEQLMKDHGLTTSTLAQKAELDVILVERYFRDPMGATFREMFAICKALGISPNEANGDKTVVISG